jgi:hypothetical protein
MYMVKAFFFLFALSSLFFSCSMLILDTTELNTPVESVAVFVEESRFGALSSALEMYKSDLIEEGTEVTVSPWSGDEEALRAELLDLAEGNHAAWLIGDMPFVNYSLGGEIFPTDLFFSSPGTSWSDADGDGVYDGHGSLLIAIPISRINGTNEEINLYFDKIHRYRTGELTFDDRALLFKDDDWSDYRRGSTFGADRVAGDVVILERLDQSTYPSYENNLQGRFKYLYQWIHANPYALYVCENGSYTPFRYYSISEDSVDVGFLNMFNCQAARYTVSNNLAMTYLMDSDTALAVTGSTKKGGNFEPLEFHRVLSLERSWSEAYRQWYNKVGVHDDMWYLGMVILGDPALIPGGAESKGERADFSRLIGPSAEEKDHYYNLMSGFAEPAF